MLTVKGPNSEINSVITKVQFRTVIVDNSYSWNGLRQEWSWMNKSIQYFDVNQILFHTMNKILRYLFGIFNMSMHKIAIAT